MLLWAIHPSHAESVAWLAERKGLLGVMWAGACALGYARFRTGGRVAWLVLAVVGGVAAVWSKAIAAFAIAALGPIELVASARSSWRRSLTGLGAIAIAAGLAFVPVVMLAVRWSVVGGDSAALPASRIVSVLGVHGFYLRVAAGAVENAVSYPIASTGPGALDLALGVIGFVAVFVALWRGPRALKIAAVLWIFGWLPVGHLVLPLQMVFVADRYLLIPTLGVALALARRHLADHAAEAARGGARRGRARVRVSRARRPVDLGEATSCCGSARSRRTRAMATRGRCTSRRSMQTAASAMPRASSTRHSYTRACHGS